MSEELSRGRKVWGVMLMIAVTLLIFQIVAFPYVEPGSATFVISVVTTVMLLITIFGTAFLIHVDWSPF